MVFIGNVESIFSKIVDHYYLATISGRTIFSSVIIVLTVKAFWTGRVRPKCFYGLFTVVNWIKYILRKMGSVSKWHLKLGYTKIFANALIAR